RRAGHELMVHMPMEPLTRDSDPGPNALLVGLARGELERRLHWNLSRFDGFVGVNNHMGSRFTSHHGAMAVVARELKRRGLLFLDSRTVETSVALEVATAEGVPSTTRDVFIDHSQQPEKIAQQLRMVERIARRTGQAIAIAHPHDATLKALRRWLPSLAERGFALVPLSAIVVDKYGEPAPQIAGKPKDEADTPG
nr:divergent polysaccharide deacetylase family protein [Alphaproteobacteria bacterium]